MDCETCREELSARMDGEPGQVDGAAVDLHLVGCAACTSWERQAGRITRTIRVRPASSTPDLTAAILAAAIVTAADSRRSRTGRQWRLGRGDTWRWLMGLIALTQLSLGVTQLLGVSDMGHMVTADSEHLFNESTAWNIALGIGFAAAAVWPRLAGGLLPTLGVFVAVLTMVSAIDLVRGDVEPSRVASHVVVVVGMAVLFVVHRQFLSRPGPARAWPDGEESTVSPTMPDRRAAGGQSGRGGLRPAGRHAA